jgi:uncharacterized glyoxalase superfamily protein PhnB
MRLVDHYPLITTPAREACRDFYVRHFGFEVRFEASWFLYLHRPGMEGESPISLAFMTPDHPSTPPGPEVFNGLGAIMTFQVEDAEALHAECKAAGVPISYPLTKERWGQLRFSCTDPSGLMLDIVQQIEPAPGFWEPYTTA